MNLICFPHYTCGGLLCDIFQNTFSEIGHHGGIDSILHNVGKIGDSADIYENFDINEFYRRIHPYKSQDVWLGTHCHPEIIDTSIFNKIIVITTATYQSKLYRWVRSCYHYYEKTDEWRSLSALDLIDKQRETAKNYLKDFRPVVNKNVINLEFSEVVNCSTLFKKITQQYSIAHHMERWKNINYFLYEKNFWNNNYVQRFYEAEYEINLQSFYEYQ